MKYSFSPIIAALVFCLMILSCTKGINGVDSEVQLPSGEERIITASFIPSTKTYLGDDKFTPKFSEGDKILVSNGSSTEVCEIEVSGSATLFRTRLTGTLKAVYPSQAAVLSGNQISGVQVPVYDNQVGRFKDANIAMAEDITTSAQFKNKTSVLMFYVDESIGVKSITIESTENISRGGEPKKIVLEGYSYLISYYTQDNPDPRICYVSVPPGVNAVNMTITVVTTSQGTVTKHPASVTLAEGTMYKAFIPYYVEIKVKSNPDAYQRWSYCNLGAFLPEEEGLFFSWADIVGHKHISNHTFENDYQFTKENCKYYEETVSGVDKYSKYNSSDGLTVLVPEDDAATVRLGEGWHIPTAGNAYTTGDFYTLKSGTYWGYSDIIGRRGVYVFDISDAPGKTAGTSGSLDGLDTSKAKLYFPYTGRTDDYSHYVDALGGYYWSSTAFSSYYASAYHLKFSSPSSLELTYTSRYYGMPIRPIAVSPTGVYFDSLVDSETVL